MTPESPFATWESFYVVVGSSGAALIGLQFVVVTLIASLRGRAFADAISAFSTPTVVHLTYALVVSAAMSAPWPSLGGARALLALLGIGGVVYGAIVLRRARRQSDYRPVLEDWIWFTILPWIAHVLLAVGALLLPSATTTALFLIAASALSLLLIGIHNAWDTVTHLVIRESSQRSGTAHDHRGGSKR